MTSRMFATAAAQANLVVRVGRPCAPTAAFSGSAAALRRQEQRPTPQQQQRQRSEQRQAAAAAGQAPRRRRLRQVAAAVAAPAATGPAASAEWGADVLAAVDAVRLASRLCQAVQVQLKRGEASAKDDESPVTVADYGAQALVAWSLRRSYPGQAVSLVAEEDAVELRAPGGEAMLARITALVNEALAVEHPQEAPLSPGQVADLIDSGDSAGGGTGRHWVLDPIDGTRGFVGMRQYAVCLGLLQDGQVVLGVLGCPNLPQAPISEADCDEGQAGRSFSDEGVGTMFAAAKGQGTWAGPVFGGVPGERVFCNDVQPLGEVRYMESWEARHSNHGLAQAIAAEIGVTRPSLRLDSQAKYGALARGDAAAFMRFPDPSYREKIWDHAAGVAILQEAGAVISDAAGRPLDFSEGRYFPDLAGGIVAATPSVHAAIVAAVAKIRAAQGGSSAQ